MENQLRKRPGKGQITEKAIKDFILAFRKSLQHKIAGDLTLHHDIAGDVTLHPDIADDVPLHPDIAGDLTLHPDIAGDVTLHPVIAVDATLHPVIADDVRVEIDVADKVSVESDVANKFFPELMLGVGLVAAPLGFGLIVSPPSAVDQFKRRAVVVAYYAAQAAEIIFGLVLVFISRKSFNSTDGVQPRRVHQMGKLFFILSFLPLILTICLVKLAKYE